MIGNDIVDLGNEETAGEALHPRFDRRVFAESELEALACAADPRRLRWTLWACKEAALKALRRRRGRVVFSPRRFEVALKGERASEATVRHQGAALAVAIHAGEDFVHATAWPDASRAAATVAAVERARGSEATDSSRAVRELASRVVARALGADPARVRIESDGRLPAAVVAGVGPVGILSLSHHGRFVAAAWMCDPFHIDGGFVAPAARGLLTLPRSGA